MAAPLAVPESVETERLILRGPALSDAQQLFESYTSDARVTRFLSWQRSRRTKGSRLPLSGQSARRPFGKHGSLSFSVDRLRCDV
ncbi:Acetyltransferase (GNAT) domain protein [Hyphomicrobium sp. 1Nfss2.1]